MRGKVYNAYDFLERSLYSEYLESIYCPEGSKIHLKYPQERSTSPPAGTQNEECSVHERETKPPAKHFKDNSAGDI
jgi:hypothetical protein